MTRKTHLASLERPTQDVHLVKDIGQEEEEKVKPVRCHHSIQLLIPLLQHRDDGRQDRHKTDKPWNLAGPGNVIGYGVRRVAALPCLLVAALLFRLFAALPCQSRPCPSPARAALPCRAAPLCRAAPPYPTATASATATATASTTIASPNVLTFDAEGREVDFEVWVDDLQLFLQCDSRDGVSLFDHTSGISVAPAADADSVVRSQWTTRDAAARPAVRSHLPSTERAHFSQYKTAQTLLRAPPPLPLLPYLFPDLAAFATVADLITHLRTSDTRYRAALPSEFCAKNPPPMYITLYYLVTRLPDSLRSPLVVTLMPLSSRGDPPSPFCPLLPLLLLSTSLAPSWSALRLLLAGGAAAAGARGARVQEETAGAAVVAVEAAKGVGVEVGVVAGVGASVAVVEVEAAAAAAVGEAAAAVGVAAAAAVGVAVVVVLVGVALCSGEALVVASASSSSVLVKPCRSSSFVSGTLGVGGLGSPDAIELSRWGDLLWSGVAIFDLDYDAILAAMYAVTISAEGDCYLCVPPDPGIESAALGAGEVAALGASESAAPGAGETALSGTASAHVLHTFTLDSGASRSFSRNCTTLSLLSRPLAVSLADPSGGPVLAHSSTVLPCPAVPSGSLSGLHLPSFSTNLVNGADLLDAWVDQFTPGGQRVTHCSCTRTGRHLATFTRQLGSSLYTLTTVSPLVAESGKQNGIAERRIGMVMDVARTSMIHAAAPHFLRMFAVQYATHQLNLQPWVSMPETTPTLRWAGKVGDASAFRVWGSRAFVRDLSADKLSSCAVPCIFLGFPPDVPDWQFYHPTLHRVLSSQDVTFDESDPAPSGVSLVDAVEPVEVAVDSGAARGAEPGGVVSGGAEPGGVESGGAEPERAEPGVAEPGVAESKGAEREGAEPGGTSGALSRREPLSPQQLREWFAWRWSYAARAGGATGARGPAAARAARGSGATGPEGARTGGFGAAGASGGLAGAGFAGGVGAGGAAGAGAPGGAGVGAAGATGGAVELVALQELELTLGPASPLPAPSPYTGPTGGLTERREPESRPASPVREPASRPALPVRATRTSHRGSRHRPPPVPGTHQMALRPSTAPQRFPLSSPRASSPPCPC
ncbi:unnamed protein product [Closterium sp. NIES-54]